MTDQITARFDTLGELLRDIALRAGLRFRVVQVGGALKLQVLPVPDRRSTVRMDIDNGMLQAQRSAVSAPEVTSVIVAGQGEGEFRTLLEVSTTSAQTAEAAWGRQIQVFKDQRQTNDIVALQQAGTQALADGAGGIALSAVPTDETTMQLDRDYSVGDIVTAIIDGQETASNVTEVKIVAGPRGVQVGFSLGDSLKFDAARRTSSQIGATNERVSALERTITSTPPLATLPGITIGASQPASMSAGWVWVDTSGATTVVKVWTGTAWK